MHQSIMLMEIYLGEERVFLSMRKEIMLFLLFLIFVLDAGCIASTYKKYGDIIYKEIPGVDPRLLSLDIYQKLWAL